jgi:hypothetical protein
VDCCPAWCVGLSEEGLGCAGGAGGVVAGGVDDGAVVGAEDGDEGLRVGGGGDFDCWVFGAAHESGAEDDGEGCGGHCVDGLMDAQVLIRLCFVLL